MNEVLVSADGITKIFRGNLFRERPFTAVSNLSLKIERGSVFGLVGESGSGKTTVARCLLYLERPTAGHVTFAGKRLDETPRTELRKLRHRMQIIFQDPNNALNPRISVYRSLAEGIANLGVRGKELVRRVEEMAEIVSVPAGHLGRKPGEFSGGQRQRLVIARSLLMNPEFLVLDEPVSNLDVSIQAQIINLLMDLKKQFHLTYLFISHDLNLVAYVSDIVGVMHSGRVVEVGPAEVVLKKPLHGYTRALLASSTHLSGRGITESSPHVLQKPIRRARVPGGAMEGCAFAEYCEYTDGACFDLVQELIDVGDGHFVACSRIR